MNTTTKCQHGLVFSTLGLLVLIVALVVFLSPVNRRSGAFITPVTRTSNVSATRPYRSDRTAVVVPVVAVPVVTNVAAVPVVTNTRDIDSRRGNTGRGRGRTATDVQYVTGPDGVVYTVPVATASAVVDGTSRNNNGRGKRHADNDPHRGGGSVVVTVYPVSAYGAGYMVSGNVSSLVPAETYVVTFHQFGDVTEGCEKLGQGLRVGDHHGGKVNKAGGGGADSGDNYIRHALVDSNGTIISTGNVNGATTYVLQNGVPVATNLNTVYVPNTVSNLYAPNGRNVVNVNGRNGNNRGGNPNAAVLQPVSDGTGYTVVNVDGQNQTFYRGARAYGQNYNQNGLPSNVAYFIPGVDYSGNDTSYFANDPNGVFNKMNPVSVKGTGNNDHVVYQNNTQNDESNVKFLPLRTVVNATNVGPATNTVAVPVGYVPTSYASSDNYVRGDGRRRRNKRQSGQRGGGANRRDAQDYDGTMIGSFETDGNGIGNFDFYVPDNSACGNPSYMYGRTVAIRPVYGTTRDKRQAAGDPVLGVFGRDVDVVDGNGLNYQQGSAANQGQVVVVRADRLMPVDRDFARQMKSEGMRARFERMTNKQGMGAGMRMGQPISCGILGRA